MATIAALFNSEAEASAAIDAIDASKYGDVQTEVYRHDSDDEEDANAGAVPAPETSRILAAPHTGDMLYGLEESTQNDFMRHMLHGSVLVLALVEDEQAQDLETFFETQGGRTTPE